VHRPSGHMDATGRRRDRSLGAPALRTLATLIMLLAATLTSCVESRRGPWEGASPSEPVRLEIRNNHFLDVVVYALPDGGRSRVGTVTGKSDAVLEIPTSVVARSNGFRLEVDPVGSAETYVSEVIFVNPGTVVVLDVGSALSMSSWHLR
jgi:hypothetical protein